VISRLVPQTVDADRKKIAVNVILVSASPNLLFGLTHLETKDEGEFKSLFAKLDNFIALDTARNDFLYHAKLYEWLNAGRGVNDLESFNSRVYDQVFKTPDYDKWLGLYSSDVYTALDGNGLT
jgi:hypothetical protein